MLARNFAAFTQLDADGSIRPASQICFLPFTFSALLLPFAGVPQQRRRWVPLALGFETHHHSGERAAGAEERFTLRCSEPERLVDRVQADAEAQNVNHLWRLGAACTISNTTRDEIGSDL